MNSINKFIYLIILTFFVSNNSFADCSYELFSISSTKNSKIIDFIDQLSDECEFTIIITDKQANKILNKKLNKTHLKNLTIEEVLNIILNENNLSYTLENNLLKISYLTTKVFSIDYILSQRKGSGSTDVTLTSSSSQDSSASSTSSSSGTSSNADSGIKIESSDEVLFWHKLDLEFQKVLNRPEDSYKATAPLINKNAGLVTVTATSVQLRRLSKYLKRLQKKVQLQVLIDVKLLTVSMNSGRTTGIDWTQLYALEKVKISADLLKGKNVGTFTATGGLSTLGADADKPSTLLQISTGTLSLDEVIKFLKTQGDVNSISNPKVLTLNNQPALITSGTELYYKITSTETLAGGTTGTQSKNEEIKSVFAGVLLDITPEISNDNSITLKINPSISEPTSSTLPTDRPPNLSRRQLSAVVSVKDGNRIILGGLITTKNANSTNKVPLLGDIPLLGYLFKHESVSKTTEELVIIIEPHIVKKNEKHLSLSDLGYKAMDDKIKLNKPSKKENEQK